MVHGISCQNSIVIITNVIHCDAGIHLSTRNISADGVVKSTFKMICAAF